MQLTRNQRAGINGAAATRRFMKRTGYTYAGQRLWDDREIEALRSIWPDRQAALAALPGRTLAAVEHMAAKLGLRRGAGHAWTGAEAVRFRRLWPAASKRAVLEAFPWATWTSLCNYSQWQRANGFPSLYRPKVRPSRTGDKVVDAILDQAVHHNFNLAELDAAARTGRYFAAGRHRYRRTWKHLARAVGLFGGDLSATFPVEGR